MDSQNLRTQRRKDAKENVRHVAPPAREITIDDVAAALNRMAGDCASARERNARALGHAEAMLYMACFQTAVEWSRVRNQILEQIREAS